jgi:hypothetical protein
MPWLYENLGMILAVLGLAGAGLVFLGYFGHIRFACFGGMRMPWDDIDFMVTEKERRVCMIIGPLLWAVALFLCVMVSIGGK